MADLTRHVLVDSDTWPAGSKPYDKSGALPYKADFNHQCCGMDQDWKFGVENLKNMELWTWSDTSCDDTVNPTANTTSQGTKLCRDVFGHNGWSCDPDMKICFCGQSMSCLNGLGITFVAVFTYFGFALLMVGIFWTVDIMPKLRKQWADIRRAAAAHK